MAELLRLADLQGRVLEWARGGHAEGWLSARDIASLERIEDRSPDMLFASQHGRPLVAAFFGGTGVGKSTLLNRLAGQDIARTGVVRPTSREVSVYLHEAVLPQFFPPQLPVDRVRVAHHANERYRHVLWVDMPDFDSTDVTNHQLALDWLPHIDVVIYVVSPERYRDDRGWRLLLDHELEYAWLFVLNQWDRAHPAQWDDFKKLLIQSGFSDPIIFRTDSRADSGQRRPDEFPQFEHLIQMLAERRAMEQLTRHNLQAKSRVLAQAVSALVDKLGSDERYERLADSWDELWTETSGKLIQGLQWSVRELAARFVQREGNPLQRSLNLNQPAKPVSLESSAVPLLWDDWAQLCFEDSLDRLLVECDRLDLPAEPLAMSLRPLRAKALRLVLDAAQTALREALARPGNTGQRLLLKLSGLLAVLMPLTAISWVSYEVVLSYYQSVQAARPFLGADFAVHSGLLIAVAWLFPYFLHRKLRPSSERTAVHGLQLGLRTALGQMDAEVDAALKAFRKNGTALRAAGLQLASGTEAPVSTEPYASDWKVDLRRLLANAPA